jgi:hypothetical protein
MRAKLASITFCQQASGLASHELMLGVAPGGKERQLLAKHRRARRSPAMARVCIVADLRAALARGAAGEAANLLLALRRLLALPAEVALARRGARQCGRRVFQRREGRRNGGRGRALALPFRIGDKFPVGTDGV